MWKKYIGIALLAMVSGMIGAVIIGKTTKEQTWAMNVPTNASLFKNASLTEMPDGFVKASAVSTPAVVFIKNESTVQYSSPFGWFWDYDPFGSRGKATSTGSGVIVSGDGYIVTNNHVINGADKITVVLNKGKKEYVAKIIGLDPSTDLALLKIDAKNLPAITMVNSDGVQVGDWVLAVGNPFNLTSTVTAGIVSAKGRNINIVQNQFPIESFIQTDAAINPGNSGGALVNTAGQLVGINTAIQSNTGSYAGYGFAIPSNIVRKIVDDFIEFGEVKRAFPGLETEDISADKLVSLKLDKEGVIVKSILEDGPAADAGLKVGDVILKLNSKNTVSKAIYDELLSYQRPGAEIELLIWRNNEEKVVAVKLIDKTNNEALRMKGAVNSKLLGADFQPLSSADLAKYNVKNGIRLLNVQRGSYINQIGLSDGFIITSLNGIAYSEAEELISAMESSSGRISIEGLTKEGSKQSFSFYTR